MLFANTAKRRHITIITRFLQTNENTYATHWIADVVVAAVGEGKELANKVLGVYKRLICRNYQQEYH
jgi:hypothetical protein